VAATLKSIDYNVAMTFILNNNDNNNNGEGNMRPLIVQLASYSDKNRIMQFVYKLRNAEQKYKGVIIANDNSW